MAKPLVSICCITFNHELYIQKCLDGFIEQKTDFDIEILIHDDASTDKTADIIREYEKKYPEIIKPIYQCENQYSKGVRPINKFNFPRATGKYIAMCEGDDYWTDPLKLQKQVNFMEENENYVACGCYADIERFGELVLGNDEYIEKSATSLDFVEKGIFPTLTVLFRNRNFNNFLKFNPIVGDIELFMYLSQFGDFKKLPFKGAVYRYHGQGVNSGDTYYNNRKKNILAKLNFNKHFNLYPKKVFKRNLRKIIFSEFKFIVKKIFSRKYCIGDNVKFIIFCIQQYRTL